MSIQDNKDDFEGKLSDLEYILTGPSSHSLDTIVGRIDDVICEYNGHLKDDIETIINSEESLQEKVRELKDQFETKEEEVNTLMDLHTDLAEANKFLQIQLSDSESRIDELEDSLVKSMEDLDTQKEMKKALGE